MLDAALRTIFTMSFAYLAIHTYNFLSVFLNLPYVWDWDGTKAQVAGLTSGVLCLISSGWLMCIQGSQTTAYQVWTALWVVTNVLCWLIIPMSLVNLEINLSMKRG